MSPTQGVGPPTVQVKAVLTLLGALFSAVKGDTVHPGQICMVYKYGGCVRFVAC